MSKSAPANRPEMVANERDLGAELDAVIDQVTTLSADLAAVSARCAALDTGAARAESVARIIAADLAETTSDLAAVVGLLGGQLGEPFRARATAIVTTRQTSQEG